MRNTSHDFEEKEFKIEALPSHSILVEADNTTPGERKKSWNSLKINTLTYNASLQGLVES